MSEAPLGMLGLRRSLGIQSAPSLISRRHRGLRAASMQETTEQLSASPAIDDLVASARKAGDWAGEPLLHGDEDPAQVLAPGTARRNALDEALAEIEAGNKEPSSQWKVRFALMLGLERVLSEKPPHLASGTELRRHQVDALAGMLTELIAANQRAGRGAAERQRSANGHVEPGDPRRRTRTSASSTRNRCPRSCRRPRTPAPSAATGSGTRPRRARRSPPPGSSRRPARWAS